MRAVAGQSEITIVIGGIHEIPPEITLAAAALTVLVTTVCGAPAWGDAVYHSQHIALQPVGSAPLRAGFVENIHANGPTVYAMERYALVGAAPGSYAVTLHLFADTSCTSVIGPSPSITFTTNAAGNGVGHLRLPPSAIPAEFHGATIRIIRRLNPDPPSWVVERISEPSEIVEGRDAGLGVPVWPAGPAFSGLSVGP